MLTVFYIAAAIALIATARVIVHTQPVHALLNLIISFIAVAVIFVALGAPFAGILEVIVYAGAIMVLFVFVVMMLNLGDRVVAQERAWLSPRVWILPSLLAAVLLASLIYALSLNGTHAVDPTVIGPKAVGMALFGPYLLVVELASFLLLAALVTAWHLGRADEEQGS